MSGGQRESLQVGVRVRSAWKHRGEPWGGWRAVWRYVQAVCRNPKLAAEDNFGPLVCSLKGHRPYVTSMANEPLERACLRCHRYLPEPKEAR